jgi:putative ABC transport system permease protein
VKLFKYIWRNATRNKLRSMLTVLSVAFSLALMTVLYGYLATQAAWKTEAQKHHRIVVMNVQGFAGALPIAYVDRVASTEGVEAAVPYSWFGGLYKDEATTLFAQFGTDPRAAFDVWDEYEIDAQQLAAWQSNRRGCVVDRRLAERRGWQIGERIPLQGTFYQYNLDLELVGIFDTPQPIDSLWFHWEYLDEGLRQGTYEEAVGNAGIIFAKAQSPAVMPTLSRTIDEKFGSSENPTRTQTEAAFAQMFADMFGNVQTYVRNISVIVMFSLMLVAANGMAMSMRERTTEIAVLKAIGFRKGRVLGMVLGESCFIAGLGGLLGLTGGAMMLQLLNGVAPQLFPFAVTDMAGWWMLLIIAIAVVIGLASGVVPAIRAARLSVVDGLRRVV